MECFTSLYSILCLNKAPFKVESFILEEIARLYPLTSWVDFQVEQTIGDLV